MAKIENPTATKPEKTATSPVDTATVADGVVALFNEAKTMVETMKMIVSNAEQHSDNLKGMAEEATGLINTAGGHIGEIRKGVDLIREEWSRFKQGMEAQSTERNTIRIEDESEFDPHFTPALLAKCIRAMCIANGHTPDSIPEVKKALDALEGE